MNDHDFCRLLERFGLSWSGYRKVRKGVRKRLVRRMHGLGCLSAESYFSILDESSEERRECVLLLTVSISRFFRDQRLWQSLEDTFLPELLERNSGMVKVWSAGCARGEEVYSLKIVWHSLRSRLARMPDLRVVATDMNPVYLERARVGLYLPSSLKEVPEPLRDRYFHRPEKGEQYSVVPYLRTGITWSEHNLLDNPLETGFRLIFLRNNILTYYEDGLRDRAFRNALDSLAPGGLLVIGAHERLPAGTVELAQSERHPCIFKKRRTEDT
jgi:chemotaxis methyl-accepting protein methylase